MVPLHASRYVPSRMLDTVSTKNNIFYTIFEVCHTY